MRLFSLDRFCSSGSQQIPNPPPGTPQWKAVGIHASSEVEECLIGGIKLGTKAVLPFPGSLVEATRVSMNTAAGTFSTDVQAVADGNKFPGEKLVLQLYESCDDLAPPGPRAAYKTRCFVTGLGATAAAAKVLCCLPMSQRTRAALFWNALAATVTVQLVGLRMNFGVAKGFVPIVNPTAYATPGTVVPSGSFAGGTVFTRGVYIDNESFDGLLVYAWDSAGGQIDLIAEAIGDRLA